MKQISVFWRNAWFRFGLTLMGVGGLAGVSVLKNDDDPVVAVFLGVLFFASGAFLAGRQWFRYRKAKLLMETGRCAWGKVVRVEVDTLLRFNSRYPRRLIVEYISHDGKIHTAQSASLFLSGAENYVGAQVRVYFGLENRKDFYVDTDSLFESAERF